MSIFSDHEADSNRNANKSVTTAQAHNSSQSNKIIEEQLNSVETKLGSVKPNSKPGFSQSNIELNSSSDTTLMFASEHGSGQEYAEADPNFLKFERDFNKSMKNLPSGINVTSPVPTESLSHHGTTSDEVTYRSWSQDDSYVANDHIEVDSHFSRFSADFTMDHTERRSSFDSVVNSVSRDDILPSTSAASNDTGSKPDMGVHDREAPILDDFVPQHISAHKNITNIPPVQLTLEEKAVIMQSTRRGEETTPGAVNNHRFILHTYHLGIETHDRSMSSAPIGTINRTEETNSTREQPEATQGIEPNQATTPATIGSANGQLPAIPPTARIHIRPNDVEIEINRVHQSPRVRTLNRDPGTSRERHGNRTLFYGGCMSVVIIFATIYSAAGVRGANGASWLVLTIAMCAIPTAWVIIFMRVAICNKWRAVMADWRQRRSDRAPDLESGIVLTTVNDWSPNSPNLQAYQARLQARREQMGPQTVRIG
ncbi:hypothetical protein EDC01DRAFT_751963 [Geopyxis carbonaria]|nr:hypothetical protein EDC01DRAFT_751963 [Geopyxis carbonaria]